MNMWQYLQPMFAHNGIEDQPADLMRRPDARGYDYAAWWEEMNRRAPRRDYVPEIASDGYYHWPSQFKGDQHQSRVLYIDGKLVDTRSGEEIMPTYFGSLGVR